jgi:hypothetical protein
MHVNMMLYDIADFTITCICSIVHRYIKGASGTIDSL